jgi:threonine dehydrogenase-like Zn-dependent dehydrogenase
VRALGATYHRGGLEEAGRDVDVVIECTGAPHVVFDVMRETAPGGIVCLTGVSTGGREMAADVGALDRGMALENDAVFGSFNANRRHYEAAADALARADRAWLEGPVTRRVPLASWPEALARRANDVKVVIEPGA